MNGINICSTTVGRRNSLSDKIDINVNCVDFNYLIGLLATDGCISNPKTSYTVRISLQNEDADVLYKLYNKFGGKIVEFKRSCEEDHQKKRMEYTAWTLLFKPFHEFLHSIGFTHNKTYTLDIRDYFKALDCGNKAALLRGMLDGDGSVQILQNQKKTNMFGKVTFGTASPYLAEIFGSEFPFMTHRIRKINNNKDDFYTFRTAGKKTCELVYNRLYSSEAGDMCLNRKLRKHQIIQEYYTGFTPHTNIYKFEYSTDIFTVKGNQEDFLKEIKKIYPEVTRCTLVKALKLGMYKGVTLHPVKSLSRYKLEQIQLKYGNVIGA